MAPSTIEIQSTASAPGRESQRREEASGEARTIDVKPVPYVVPANVAQSLPPVILDRLLLGSLADGRLRVRVPLNVTVHTEGSNLILEAEELSEFGFGQTFAEAVRDLQRAIVELYLRLEEEQSRLGPELERVWERLKEVLQRRP